jgi:hypothetical protein
MSSCLVRLATAAATVLALTACSSEASPCDRLDALGDEPGPPAPVEQQERYAEAFAQCMREEPERGSDQ